MQKYRFHVLTLPHTITTPEYNACAYTMKILKFCKMMKARGHYIMHYGHADSNVDCNEHITILDNSDLKKAYGSYDWKKDFFEHNVNDHCHKKYNLECIKEIIIRIQERDFVLPFWGKGHLPIIKAINDDKRAIVVEPGIGYHDSFSEFRIYESWSIAHHTMGAQNTYKPSWYHTVIPNYFDIKDFSMEKKREDFFLFIGRIDACKGVHIAIQLTEKIGAKLVIAGQGDICKNLEYETIPEHVEYVGYVDIEKRKELMSKAKGFLIFSDYVEPFGGAAVEAMMSGCPVISSDWGAFTETILHGITGYRCRTFEQMCWAGNNINKINPETCRKWAVDNYSLEKVSEMYEEYFTQVYNLWKKGWYEENNERTQLDWLYKKYPSEI
jgi:glycosyltransferase involved in cell wall biosynthesis